MSQSSQVQVRLAEPSDAAAMLQVIHRAFGARRAVVPPAAALADTHDDVLAALLHGHGVLALRDEQLVGCLLVAVGDGVATLRRVSVLPEEAGSGVAHAMVEGALSLAVDLGCTHAELLTRRDFPELAAWWGEHGFSEHRPAELGHVLRRSLPVIVDVPDADQMRELGFRLAGLLRPGDLIIASGQLGAGKTTLAQGIGAGLGVAGAVISPTFVISRIHPNPSGPALVHVDAYRMSDAAELADVDLDHTLAGSVTLIEWGEQKAEWLSPERLEIRIARSVADEVRTVYLDGVGQRWDGALESLRSAT